MTLEITNNTLTGTPEEIDLQDEALSTLNVQVLFDCCTEVYNEDMTIPYEGETLEVPHTVNEEDDLFKDGVYQMVVTATYENGSIITETRCIFADTSLKCSIADFLATNPKSELGPLYVVLVRSNSCECNCGAACEIMKSIRSILGQTPASCNCN